MKKVSTRKVKSGNTVVVCPTPQRVTSPRENLDTPREHLKTFRYGYLSARSSSQQGNRPARYFSNLWENSLSRERSCWTDESSPRSALEDLSPLVMERSASAPAAIHHEKPKNEVMRIMAQTNVLIALKIKDEVAFNDDEEEANDEQEYEGNSFPTDQNSYSEKNCAGSVSPPQRPSNPFDYTEVNYAGSDDNESDDEEDFLLDPLPPQFIFNSHSPPMRPWSR